MKPNGKFAYIKQETLPTPAKLFQLVVGNFALCLHFLVYKMGVLAVSSSVEVFMDYTVKSKLPIESTWHRQKV